MYSESPCGGARRRTVHTLLVPCTVRSSVSSQGFPVVAERKIFGVDRYSAGMSSFRGARELVFAVLVVIAKYGELLRVDFRCGRGHGGESFGCAADIFGEGCGDWLEELWPTAEGVVVEGPREAEG